MEAQAMEDGAARPHLAWTPQPHHARRSGHAKQEQHVPTAGRAAI